ncbi:sulfurtransferase [Roseimicrobium gellanilyticum]|nr:sulfurtransferase [Roseimicrobium gellanilyticum]
MPDTLSIQNIAAYKFAPLQDLRELRTHLLAKCKGWNLKGTILLSPEGINLFIAGEAPGIESLLAELRSLPGLADLTPKYSETDHQPFRRMLVRLKKEIITFGVEGINPALRTSPKLQAKELKQWLDEGRPVTLLDTRNDYEVKLGTFKNALPIGIDTFKQFPDAVRKLPEGMKDQPVVMFCTGGIRCEKAGPFMEREGFKHILQLDGGILKYFEECGADHYDGECFVFDQRVGVDPALQETESTQCFQCQTPLSEEDQQDTRYVVNESCPYCFKEPADKMQENIARRQEAIAKLTSPLPGSAPYENLRPFNIPAVCDGMPLAEALARLVVPVSLEAWIAACESGRVLNADHEPVSPTQVVYGGQRYLHVLGEITEPDVNADIKILHEDEAIIVLNKPAPLPVHPGGRFNRNTLRHILHEVYRPQKPRQAHRLDANTSGVMVYARTKHFAGKLQPQFTAGEVGKFYLVRVQGHPEQDAFACDAPIGNESGTMGTREVDDAHGRQSRTEFKVLRRDDDGTALLEARPLTGRTNQIRLHLAHLGWPVLGDQAYLSGIQRGDTQTHEPEDAPLCLHSSRIQFVHPLTRERVEFTAPAPAWAE